MQSMRMNNNNDMNLGNNNGNPNVPMGNMNLGNNGPVNGNFGPMNLGNIGIPIPAFQTPNAPRMTFDNNGNPIVNPFDQYNAIGNSNYGTPAGQSINQNNNNAGNMGTNRPESSARNTEYYLLGDQIPNKNLHLRPDQQGWEGNVTSGRDAENTITPTKIATN